MMVAVNRFAATIISISRLCERPALAVFAMEERLGLGGIGGIELGGVPLQRLAGAVGDIAQVVGLGEPARVVEVAGCRRAGLAGVDPLGVVAQRLGDELLGALEVVEVLLGQEEVLAVAGQEHPLGALEQDAALPALLGNGTGRPGLGFLLALVPVE